MAEERLRISVQFDTSNTQGGAQQGSPASAAGGSGVAGFAVTAMALRGAFGSRTSTAVKEAVKDGSIYVDPLPPGYMPPDISRRRLNYLVNNYIARADTQSPIHQHRIGALSADLLTRSQRGADLIRFQMKNDAYAFGKLQAAQREVEAAFEAYGGVGAAQAARLRILGGRTPVTTPGAALMTAVYTDASDEAVLRRIEQQKALLARWKRRDEAALIKRRTMNNPMWTDVPMTAQLGFGMFSAPPLIKAAKTAGSAIRTAANAVAIGALRATGMGRTLGKSMGIPKGGGAIGAFGLVTMALSALNAAGQYAQDLDALRAIDRVGKGRLGMLVSTVGGDTLVNGLFNTSTNILTAGALIFGTTGTVKAVQEAGDRMKLDVSAALRGFGSAYGEAQARVMTSGMQKVAEIMSVNREAREQQRDNVATWFLDRGINLPANRVRAMIGKQLFDKHLEATQRQVASAYANDKVGFTEKSALVHLQGATR